MADRIVQLKLTADPSQAARAGQSLVSTFDKVARDVGQKVAQINKLGGLRESVAGAAAQIENLRNKLRDVSGGLFAADAATKQRADLRELMAVQQKAADQQRALDAARARAFDLSQIDTKPTRAQLGEIERATASADRLARGLEELRGQGRALSASLREAGVDLGRVTDEQERLDRAAAQARPLAAYYKDISAELRKMETALVRDKAAADALQASLTARNVPTGPGAAQQIRGNADARIGMTNLLGGIAEAARAKQARSEAAARFLIQQAARAAATAADRERAAVAAAARNLFGGIAEAARAKQAEAATAARNLFGGIAQAAQARTNAFAAINLVDPAALRKQVADAQQAVAVLGRLKASGQITGREFNVAFGAAQNRIRSLNAELGKTPGLLARLRSTNGSGGGLFGSAGAMLGGLVNAPGLAGGVAAAYGVGDFARSAINDSLQYDGIERALTAVTGSAKEAQDALAFVRAESERLGTLTLPGADGFKRLAASAKGSGIELAQVKELYTSLSEASVVLGLDQQRLQGIFEAFGQIMSKGKVQAEELRGQLGDRLYGAFELAARAMGMTNAELDKALEDGEVRAQEFVNNIIPILKNDFSGGVAAASTSVQASFNRMSNAFSDLKIEMANAGLLDGLADGADALAEAFRDPQLIDSLSLLAAMIGELSAALAEIGPELAVVAAIAAGAGVGSKIGGLVGGRYGKAAGAVIGGGAAILAGAQLSDGARARISERQNTTAKTAAEQLGPVNTK